MKTKSVLFQEFLPVLPFNLLVSGVISTSSFLSLSSHLRTERHTAYIGPFIWLDLPPSKRAVQMGMFMGKRWRVKFVYFYSWCIIFFILHVAKYNLVGIWDHLPSNFFYVFLRSSPLLSSPSLSGGFGKHSLTCASHLSGWVQSGHLFKLNNYTNCN